MSNYGPYSYSRMATFKKCPQKFKFAYVDKLDIPFVPSAPMIRGSAIHDTLEQFMLGHAEMLHPEIHEHYGQYFFSLREEHKGHLEPEAKWGISWDMTPCEYDAEDCMVRGYMDLRFVTPDEPIADVFEYKTGKRYPEHTHQQWLYGVATLAKHPILQGVNVTAIYLDQKKNNKIYYPNSMMFEYRPALIREIMEIENTAPEDMIPTPHFMCRYCQFSKGNGGPCQF